jgi:lycopene cyclase domain-containing protein
MEHLNGFFIGDLPIEEICFFLFVPFACLFIYEVLNGYFSLQPSKKFGQLSAVSLTIVMLVFGSIYYDRLYTSVSCFLGAILTILFYFVLRKDWYGKFVVTFLVVQLPFFVVNGILTGTMIESPIVWYNSLEMSNFRLGTIPFEDIFYNYGMLLLTFSVYIRFKKRQGLPL